ncbi:hypothetical protein K458DRAFT_416197 [Lentithecium fluviatile CBS 122367]|uniref:NAD(P)-binding protein n=1 Tax=Lentithecium fluviatile CBS 122367 TaxID=1168545 RepID=A0A6G1J8W2_9PLEO|nr:hypothetical protein K458DRAFT_416197 [Lentithecium fluviatile CBS 122367]
MLRQKPKEVDLLILGAGWTSTFLVPRLETENISHAETTTTGRDGTIPFKFDADSADEEPYKNLPSAHTVLVTFPLIGPGQSKHLVSLYQKTHQSITSQTRRWIQLGSTGIFSKIGGWNDESSAYDTEDKRAVAEDELRDFAGGCILNLAGLYGGTRQPRNFAPRLVKEKDDIRKRKAVHFVHGDDVARAIVATHRKFLPGKRWIVADLRVYDWYDLFLTLSATAEDGTAEEESKREQMREWVGELMVEEGIKALPRDTETLGRKLDSRGFWKYHGVWPGHERLA